MPDQEDVRRIALGLPETTEDGRAFAFAVAGRTFVWLWPERVDPKKPKVPNPEVVVVRVADEGEKQALLASDPAVFFTTSHYDGYQMVMVRLPVVDDGELAELLTDSWRAVAPRPLVDRLEADG